jgi:hypothetical protein
MLNPRIVLIYIFISLIHGQSSMNALGYGNFSNKFQASSISIGSSVLSSTFKENISLHNPASWHNLPFAVLNTSVSFSEGLIEDNKNAFFNLSSTTLVVPWRQKLSFGLTFSPLFSRDIILEDLTNDQFIFTENDTLNYRRKITSSGGASLAKFSLGYKINEIQSIGFEYGTVLGSSRKSNNLIIDNVNHLLQERDYFSGGIVSLFYTQLLENSIGIPITFNTFFSKSLKNIGVENEAYQSFIDLNGNSYHDSSDFPDLGQALLPIKTFSANEMSIKEFAMSFDYKDENRNHYIIELYNWNDTGDHIFSSSIIDSYVESYSKLNLGFARFGIPYTDERYDYKAGIFFGDYDLKNIDNVKEFGIGLGIGIQFGLTNNQIDISYNYLVRNNLEFIKGNETIQSFSIGLSLGDLWFVKRREM